MDVLNRQRSAAASAVRNTVLLIGGMETSGCVQRVDAALRAVQGVETCGVNLLTRLATVRHEARALKTLNLPRLCRRRALVRLRRRTPTNPAFRLMCRLNNGPGGRVRALLHARS